MCRSLLVLDIYGVCISISAVIISSIARLINFHSIEEERTKSTCRTTSSSIDRSWTVRVFVIYFWLYNLWYKKKLLHGLENQISSVCLVNCTSVMISNLWFIGWWWPHMSLPTAIERELHARQSLHLKDSTYDAVNTYDRSASATHVSIRPEIQLNLDYSSCYIPAERPTRWRSLGLCTLYPFATTKSSCRDGWKACIAQPPIPVRLYKSTIYKGGFLATPKN